MRWSRNWSRLGRSFLPALLIAGAVIALGFAMTNQGAAAASSGATVNITIGDNNFTPKSVTANVGDTIVWTNKGAVAHDVTANDGSFMSPRNLAPGATYSYTVTKAGTFGYICTIHLNQDGSLVVQAAAAPSASASASTTTPVAPPATGGGRMIGAAMQPWQQLLVLGIFVAAGVGVFVGRRVRRAM
jgi:plastocyanin